MSLWFVWQVVVLCSLCFCVVCVVCGRDILFVVSAMCLPLLYIANYSYSTNRNAFSGIMYLGFLTSPIATAQAQPETCRLCSPFSSFQEVKTFFVFVLRLALRLKSSFFYPM